MRLLESRVSDLEMDQRADALSRDLLLLESRVSDLEMDQRADTLSRDLRLLESRLSQQERDQQRTHESTDLLIRVQACRQVIAVCRPSQPPLISVITPTHNRRPWLQRCIEAMRQHDYDHWQMIVALDRCDDGSSELLESVSSQDPRVLAVAADRSGAPAARNKALEHAEGEIIVYLDDDNRFAKGWLSAVAWAFQSHPSVEVLYGALVLENPGGINPNRPVPNTLPTIMLLPFSRSHLMQDNLTDMGCIAHRRGLPEAIFDESLTSMQDWEFFGRLVCKRDPLVLPHPAVIYRTDAPNRTSRLHQDAPERAIIRDRLRRLYQGDQGQAGQP
jgi:glycosyltransferase involved in cell wall biosynthesis